LGTPGWRHLQHRTFFDFKVSKLRQEPNVVDGEKFWRLLDIEFDFPWILGAQTCEDDIRGHASLLSKNPMGEAVHPRATYA
jgi:hypothetical protein